VEYTASSYASVLLSDWEETKKQFVKIMPRDYKRVLQAEALARAEAREPAFEELVGIVVSG